MTQSGAQKFTVTNPETIAETHLPNAFKMDTYASVTAQSNRPKHIQAAELQRERGKLECGCYRDLWLENIGSTLCSSWLREGQQVMSKRWALSHSSAGGFAGAGHRDRQAPSPQKCRHCKYEQAECCCQLRRYSRMSSARSTWKGPSFLLRRWRAAVSLVPANRKSRRQKLTLSLREGVLVRALRQLPSVWEAGLSIASCLSG